MQKFTFLLKRNVNRGIRFLYTDSQTYICYRSYEQFSWFAHNLNNGERETWNKTFGLHQDSNSDAGADAGAAL